MKEPKIGEVFEFNGDAYRCEKAEDWCMGCEFDGKDGCDLLCSIWERSDDNHVIFKKIKQEIMKEEECVFKVGHRAFYSRCGFGTISHQNDERYPIVLNYDGKVEEFTEKGFYTIQDKHPSLSFTDYINDRFSQDPKDATWAKEELDFDWDCLPKWADKWVAMDESGAWYSFNKEPELMKGIWSFEGADKWYTPINPSFHPKNTNIDWKNSLYKNPKYENEKAD